jgi:CHAD domain-containing protein
MDVFIEKAGAYLHNLPDDAHADLSPLMDQWRDLRGVSREKMLAHLDSEAYARFVVQMNEFVNTPGMGVKAFEPAHPQPYRVREVAPMLVYTRLGTVRAYTQLLDNASYEQLHALRIDFKYLRYTVEFFREVLGPESGRVIDEIKRMQDHLGDLNDADVACQMLQDFLESWEPTQIHLPLEARRNPEPIVRYLAYRTDERHQLLVSFPQSWKKFLDPEFLTNLALSVSVL